MHKILFLLFTLFFYAHSREIQYDFFKDKPRSLTKDFYISLFLDQNISSKEAESLIGEVQNMNWKLFYKFADKVDDFAFKRIKYCKQLKASQYQGKDTHCIKVGLSAYKATKLSPETLNTIADQIAYYYPKTAALYKALSLQDFNLTTKLNPLLILQVFTQTGKSYREKYLNHPLPPDLLLELAKLPAFNTAVNQIVRNPKLNLLKKSILKFDSSMLNTESNFLLGINALTLGHEEIAVWYFKLSEKKAYTNFEKDKARFWQYLTTKDKKILQTLIKESKDINIYTLFAYEKLRKFPQNIVISIEPQQKKIPFNITDPFAWLTIQQKFKQIQFPDYEAKKAAALQLNSRDTQPHVSRLIYRFKDNRHYYLFPYIRYLKDLDPHRQALILALARQESRFIPTEVSYSYALGLMQFMPFLAKALAKKENIENFSYEMMFEPKTAYHFADRHIDFLEKHLFHPLLVAYAYNAGIGYTRRQIIQKEGTFTQNKYEPFLTMELLPNAQARKYGKKVLANYIVYTRLLGLKDVTLLTQLEALRKKNRISDF